MPERAPGSTCGLVEREVHAGEGLLAGLVTLRGIPAEQPVPEGLDLVKGPPLQQFEKNCSLWE